MEDLVALRDRSVLLTGHTGFKGGWLALWLAASGARVHGYALAPPTEPNIFEVARVAQVLASDTRADLSDVAALTATLEQYRPEVVFHLAAQPLVSEGYRDPLGTIATNVLGTANLLEAIRSADSVHAVVVVATDKVYENLETGQAFSERDPLGGHDPYSASKAATEIVVASYRSSFYGQGRHPANVASARAGNVIGGGDWSAHRLVPDCLRAFAAGEPVRLRSPDSVRPWQHVLGPLSGYLTLACRLLGEGGERFAGAWNFGPDDGDNATVADVARRIAALWGGPAEVVRDPAPGGHEAGLLRLDSTRARSELGWAPQWSLQHALGQTVSWHRAWQRGDDMQAVCQEQIAEYPQAVVG
ncbi:MAG: CDP-glucose 4,6-dehydratase [Candidatus Limnocylindria bacterium]